MPVYENFVADWVTIVESDIAAVPQGGTGGASPAFVTNHDISSVLEPDGVTTGTNNKVYSTSTGFDINGVADGTVGYDRIYRDLAAPTFGGGLGDFSIDFEFQYWDGMARGTGYVLLGLANSSAPRFYNGAGKGITPAPTGTAGWDILVDDSTGYWFGEDGSGGTTPAASFDLVGAGFPARADGTLYYVRFAWDDINKLITITEYTDATRSVSSATVSITPANTAFTAQFVVCNVNENQIKTAFSGRDQQAVLQNLDLGLAPAGLPTEIREVFNDSTGAPYANGTAFNCHNADGSVALSGVIGTVVGTDIANPVIVAPAAGEAVITFPFGNVTSRYIVIDPTVDTDGLVTNLLTPVQLV